MDAVDGQLLRRIRPVQRLHVVEDRARLGGNAAQGRVECEAVVLAVKDPVRREIVRDRRRVHRRDGADNHAAAARLQRRNEKPDVFLIFRQAGVQHVRHVQRPAAVIRADHDMRQLRVRAGNIRIHGCEQVARFLSGDGKVMKHRRIPAQRLAQNMPEAQTPAADRIAEDADPARLAPERRIERLLCQNRSRVLPVLPEQLRVLRAERVRGQPVNSRHDAGLRLPAIPEAERFVPLKVVAAKPRRHFFPCRIHMPQCPFRPAHAGFFVQ